jgi:hypothetical protein
MAASADHLKALVQAHAVGDEESFYAVALQVAAKAARQGHNRLAADLRDMINIAKTEELPRREPTRSSGPRVSWRSSLQPSIHRPV